MPRGYRGGIGRHIDYDTPRDDAVDSRGHAQLTTDKLIQALIAKDTPIEVVRVPTHILDTMLHAEPVDDVIKDGEIDVTRVNLTQLRVLLQTVEKHVEKVPLSRWHVAPMAPTARVDLPQTRDFGHWTPPEALKSEEEEKKVEVPIPPPPHPRVNPSPADNDAPDENPFEAPSSEYKPPDEATKLLLKLARENRTPEEKAAERERKLNVRRKRRKRKGASSKAAAYNAAASSSSVASAAPKPPKIPKLEEAPQKKSAAPAAAAKIAAAAAPVVKTEPVVTTEPAEATAEVAPAAAKPAAPAAKPKSTTRPIRESPWDRPHTPHWHSGPPPFHYPMDLSSPYDYRNDFRGNHQGLLPPPPPSGHINYIRPPGYHDPLTNNYVTRSPPMADSSWLDRPRNEEYYHDTPYYGFR